MADAEVIEPETAAPLPPEDGKEIVEADHPTRAADGPGVPRTSTLLNVIGETYNYRPGDENDYARSPEDAAWLHRHGYMDTFSHSYLVRADVEELRAAADQDLRIQVMAALRMAMSGRYGNEPILMLQDAAARGSVYALEVLGDVYFTAPAYRNPALGAAYYDLVIRRGDWAVAFKKRAQVGNLAADRLFLADLYAEAAWQEIVALRQRLGLLPFAAPEPRPGLHEGLRVAQELMAGQGG
ncbi:hypothetical protein [Arenimonas fontis]|uniref:Uncharacterized protein n=1 Tax=Arenimonas fontis TaxID=2608255 RepID=A0A5B2Z9Y3_9GAMM|nr:hypothetical protein [Arenimonas fontis]KAA2284757.1 hypothetical protein F0415_08660 [Arenimonas fontis]